MLGIEPEKKKKLVYITYVLLQFYMSRWLSGQDLDFLGNSENRTQNHTNFKSKFFQQLKIKNEMFEGINSDCNVVYWYVA
jgi:hypothetical protein